MVKCTGEAVDPPAATPAPRPRPKNRPNTEMLLAFLADDNDLEAWDSDETSAGAGEQDEMAADTPMADCLNSNTTVAQQLLADWIQSPARLPVEEEGRFKEHIRCNRKRFLTRLRNKVTQLAEDLPAEDVTGQRYREAALLMERQVSTNNHERRRVCGCADEELIAHDFMTEDESLLMEPVEVKAGRFPHRVDPPGPAYMSPLCGSRVGGRDPATGPVPAMRIGEASEVLQRPDAWNGGREAEGAGIIQEAVRLRAGFCPFMTRECVKPDAPAKGLMLVKSPDKRVADSFQAVDVAPVPAATWRSLPSIPRGSWGSCAVVASGDSVLSAKQGREIDAHKTVIRIGRMPFNDDGHRPENASRIDYSPFVGTRTDVLVAKRRPADPLWKHADARIFIDPYGEAPSDSAGEKGVLLKPNLVDKPPVAPAFAPSGGPRVLGYLLYDRMARAIGRLDMTRVKRFEDFAKGVWEGRKRKPTTGFLIALDLLFSGFCTRVDMYGFTVNCGWHYWPRRSRPMTILHSCELESWVLHHIMKEYANQLKMCVYI
eukprot:jgi/Mesvir1/21711/Mv04127-RA.2